MSEERFQPVSGLTMPRFAGIATFMRLPLVADPAELDIALVGLPFDGGTTNRPGARHGPREIRNQSSLVRRVNPESLICPFDLCRIADVGDIAVNPVDPLDTLARAEARYREIHDKRAVPLTGGGDHLGSLAVLRGIARERPVGMVQFDAHSDTTDSYFSPQTRYTHGTPFRRAIEEGLLDPTRVVQVGIRGSRYDAGELDWAREAGIRIIGIEEYFRLGADGAVNEIRRVLGDGPTYVSFDVDGVDPAYAPGTGTPEIGGYSSFEAQLMVRGLRGLDLVGGDVVEVSPPLDPAGMTAFLGATMMFEILCVLAEAVAKRKAV